MTDKILRCAFINNADWRKASNDNGELLLADRLNDSKSNYTPRGYLSEWGLSEGQIFDENTLLIFHFDQAVVNRGMRASKFPTGHKERLRADPRIGFVQWNRMGNGETMILEDGHDFVAYLVHMEEGNRVFFRDVVANVMNSYGIETYMEDETLPPTGIYGIKNLKKAYIDIDGKHCVESMMRRSSYFEPNYLTYEMGRYYFEYDEPLHLFVLQPPEWDEPAPEYYVSLPNYCSTSVRSFVLSTKNDSEIEYQEKKLTDPEFYSYKRRPLPVNTDLNVRRYTGFKDEFPALDINRNEFRERFVLECQSLWNCGELEIMRNDMGLFN